LCLNYGNWFGKQLLPEDYMRAATSRQIDNSIFEHDDCVRQGYGYQFWMLRNGGFACRGMGGQYAFCFPKQDLVIITNADHQGMTCGDRLVDDAVQELMKACAADALPEDEAAQRVLNERIAGLSLLCAEGVPHMPMAETVSGVQYEVTATNTDFTRLRFTFCGDHGYFDYTNSTGDHRLGFGLGKQFSQEFPETHYWGKQIGTPSGVGYNCNTSAGWVDPDTLLVQCWLTDAYFGNFRFTATFGESDVTIIMHKTAEHFLDTYQGFITGEVVR